MKKKVLTIISSALVVCLLFAMSITLIGCAKPSETPVPETNLEQNTKTDVSTENQTFTDLNAPAVRLTMSPYAMNRATNTVSRTLTATVLPVDAPDKSVDWTIEWCVPVFEGADISDYLTVTPESDGALSATVTAFQGFEGGSAYVTCTTRIGGYSAQCLITYDGAPESLVFVINGTDYNSTSTFVATAGQTYNVELDLRNTLGAVGSKYGNYEIKQVSMQGRFVAEKRDITNGTVTKREDVTIDLAEGKIGILAFTTSEFMNITLEGNILKIQALRSESSFMLPRVPVRTGTQYVYKEPYYDPRGGGVADDCRLYVLVEDTVSGKQSMLYVDIQSTVTGVTLSDSIFAF